MNNYKPLIVGFVVGLSLGLVLLLITYLMTKKSSENRVKSLESSFQDRLNATLLEVRAKANKKENPE